MIFGLSLSFGIACLLVLAMGLVERWLKRAIPKEVPRVEVYKGKRRIA
jgi:Na+-transporting methylmalonyl-CoA/oxaloacetate decarboxylase gamma subunit